MENITQRLSIIIEKLENGNASRFAKNAKIIPGTLHNYLKGRSPNIEAIINIRDAYNINVDWLLTGEGDMFINEGKKGGAEGNIINGIENPI